MAVKATGGFGLLRYEPGNPEFPTLPDGVQVPHVLTIGRSAGLAARSIVRTRRVLGSTPANDVQRFAGWQTETTWINPAVVDFGVIPSPVQRTVSLYNARNTSVEVTALSLPAGVTLLDSLPVTLTPYAGFTFTLEAGTAGDNTFDDIYEFTTSEGAASFRVIGRRVFTLENIPQTPMAESLFWKTDLIRSKDGTEKAYSLMYAPLAKVDYKVKFTNDIQRIKFKNQFIAGESALVVAGQKWYEMRPLRDAAQATDTSLNIDDLTFNASWKIGGPVAVTSIDGATVASGQLDSTELAPDPDVESNVLLLRFDGANGVQSDTDLSAFAHEVTFNGTAAISTAQSKFGGSSLKCGGSLANSVFVEWNSAETQLGGEDFTIELWTRLTSTDITNLFTNVALIANYDSRIDAVWNMRLYGAGLIFQCAQPSNTTFFFGIGSPSWQADQWYHIRMIRSGNDLTCYVDGLSIGTNNMTGAMPIWGTQSPSQYLSIGAYYNSGFTYPFSGYIDDVRITKGLARNSGDFALPTERNPSLADTYLQLNLGSEIGAALDAGSYVMPVGLGYVSRFPTYLTHPKNLEEANYQLTFNQEGDFSNLDPLYFPTLTDAQSPETTLPILEFCNEVSNGRKASQIQRSEDVLSSGLANRIAFSYYPFSDSVSEFEITLNNVDDVWAWRTFFHYLRGSYNEFYVPTFTDDMPGVVTAASNVFDITDQDLALLFGNPPDPRRNAIRLVYPNGNVYYRLITQVIDNGATEEVTVSSAVEAGSPVISYLQRARILGDTVSFEHHRVDDVSLRFRYRTILL